MKNQHLSILVLIIHIFIATILCEKDNILSYGSFVDGESTTFKLHAPKADKVGLVIFQSPEDSGGAEYPMIKTGNSDWTISIKDAGYGTLYGYRIDGPSSTSHQFDPKIIIADPYSKAAVTQNRYRHIAKTLIIDTQFNWDGDTWIDLEPTDLIIYEMHIRDMTAHSSSGCSEPGTYKGFLSQDQRGGLTHLKELGINAVQILPAMDFANTELPYLDKSTPLYNSWNPYSQNHWGYMTTFFFAPESYYASDGTGEHNAWNGVSGKAVTEFKEMIKSLHREKIAVIMDVVYNHVSNYDYHPFKYIDRELYFRLNEHGEYIAQSGCGNDTRTENPAVRQMILESLKYWMTEYHVDGFRFDLGYLIDAETRTQIINELREINPQVIILAEPWGGGYDPNGFSDMGWASFNDLFRNGVKGQNPNNGLGFIFGEMQGENNQESLKRYVMGSLRQLGGQYLNVTHSVNYLESHDDYTLGDFIRIGTKFVSAEDIIDDRITNAKVSGRQLALNKLGALFLFTSQGVTFLHQGQEWGRSKVIAETDSPDPNVGKIDHNSYEKDNETNWLNWNEKEMNRELVEYYKGLITLRKNFPAFRTSSPSDFKFFDVGNQVAVVYTLQNTFFVGINGDSDKPLTVFLPEGVWQALVDEHSVYPDGLGIISGEISIPPASGVVLKKTDSM